MYLPYVGPQYIARPQIQSSGDWRSGFFLMVLHMCTKNQNRAVATPYNHSKWRNLNFRRIQNTTLKPQANLLILIVIALNSAIGGHLGPEQVTCGSRKRSHFGGFWRVSVTQLNQKIANPQICQPSPHNTLLIARLFAKPSRSLSLRSRGAWLAMAASLCGYHVHSSKKDFTIQTHRKESLVGIVLGPVKRARGWPERIILVRTLVFQANIFWCDQFWRAVRSLGSCIWLEMMA